MRNSVVWVENNLIARVRDPWQELWGSGKKAQKNARNLLHSIATNPVYQASVQYLKRLKMGAV